MSRFALPIINAGNVSQVKTVPDQVFSATEHWIWHCQFKGNSFCLSVKH